MKERRMEVRGSMNALRKFNEHISSIRSSDLDVTFDPIIRDDTMLDDRIQLVADTMPIRLTFIDGAGWFVDIDPAMANNHYPLSTDREGRH